MDVEFKEFSRNIKKISGPRLHKIKGSYGVYDYFKYYRKYKPKDSKYVLKDSQFYTIIRLINQYLADSLEEEGKVILGGALGTLEIVTYEIKPKLGENGELIYNAPINWDATLKLWYEDPQARENKDLIKLELRDYCKFIYNRSKALYKNKMYYDFSFNKELKLRISKRVKEGKLKLYQTGKRIKYE